MADEHGGWSGDSRSNGRGVFEGRLFFMTPVALQQSLMFYVAVEQKICLVAKFEKRGRLTEILKAADPAGTIVFVNSNRKADFLASFLSEQQLPTTSIHGDRYQGQIEEALDSFISGKIKILIATSVGVRRLCKF